MVSWIAAREEFKEMPFRAALVLHLLEKVLNLSALELDHIWPTKLRLMERAYAKPLVALFLGFSIMMYSRGLGPKLLLTVSERKMEKLEEVPRQGRQAGRSIGSGHRQKGLTLKYTRSHARADSIDKI